MKKYILKPQELGCFICTKPLMDFDTDSLKFIIASKLKLCQTHKEATENAIKKLEIVREPGCDDN
jgi:hypothetical protein